MLEALHPGRIDLGHRAGTRHRSRHRGRAAASVPAARRRRLPGAARPSSSATSTARSPRATRSTASPRYRARGYRPAVWMLGSSTYGAHAAGVLGMPFSFAYHFAPGDARRRARRLPRQRSGRRPSSTRRTRCSASQRVCGESDEHARWLAAPGALAFLRLRQGRPDVYPTPEEAAEYRFTPFERQLVDGWTASHVVGDPESVRAGSTRSSNAPASTS